MCFIVKEMQRYLPNLSKIIVQSSSYPQKTVDGQYIGDQRQEHYAPMVLSDFFSRKAFGKLSVLVNYSPMETLLCHR